MKDIHIGVVCDQFGNFDRGGAEVQIDNTLEALNRLDGITTEKITSDTTDIGRFDMIHFFKSSIGNYFFMEFLKKRNIPYVISTIIYPENIIFDIIKYNLLHSIPVVKKISSLKFLYYGWENAEMLFPNTSKELEFLRKIGVKTPAKVIPNGLNLSEMGVGDENSFYDQYPYLRNEKFVLNVGRIDQRKNQIRLVWACKELDMTLVLIGNNLDKSSFEEIEKINYSKLHYLGPIFDKKILYGAYKACSVFCLPSTMETPGIAAMEAAYFNKPVVITKYGGTHSYFGNHAFYVDWRSVKEIKQGIEFMLDKPVEFSTRELMEQYSWDKISEMYLYEYQNILKRS